MAELLILPIATFLYAAMVVAEGKNEHKPAYSFLSWVLAIFGFYLLGNGIYKVVHNYSEIINHPPFIELVLVPLLSVSILPFIYFFALFLTYETLFSKVNCGTKDENLAKLARRKLFRVFNINLKQLIKFSKNHGIIKIRTATDLNIITMP